MLKGGKVKSRGPFRFTSASSGIALAEHAAIATVCPQRPAICMADSAA